MRKEKLGVITGSRSRMESHEVIANPCFLELLEGASDFHSLYCVVRQWVSRASTPYKLSLIEHRTCPPLLIFKSVSREEIGPFGSDPKKHLTDDSPHGAGSEILRICKFESRRGSVSFVANRCAHIKPVWKVGLITSSFQKHTYKHIPGPSKVFLLRESQYKRCLHTVLCYISCQAVSS